MSLPAEVMFTEPAEWQPPESDVASTQDDHLQPPEPVLSTEEPNIYLEPVTPSIELDALFRALVGSIDLEPVTPTIEFDAHFRTLVRDWKQDTSHLSLISQRITHPAYKQILGMGKTALPLILDELNVEPDHWFHALSFLADAEPIPPGFCGTVSEAAELWLEWGRSKNLIPDAAERAVPDFP